MKTMLVALALLTGGFGRAHAQCGADGVFVFGAEWCPACRALERHLNAYDVAYHKFEVTNNRQVQQFMRERFGGTAIPVVVVDGDYRFGYDAGWLEQALCLR